MMLILMMMVMSMLIMNASINVYVEIFCVFLEAYDDHHHGHLLPHYLDEVLGFVKKSKSCVSRTVTADRYLTSISV